MGRLAISSFAIRTRHHEISPFISRVLKQTAGNQFVCGSIDKLSLPEIVYIAAGALSRLARVKSMYPEHTNLYRF